MKIGIITFWQSQDNYGQILQCWALQKYLSRKGYQIFLIRYTHETPKPLLGEQIKKIIKIYPVFIKIIRYIKSKRKNKTNYTELSPNRHFDDFKNKYIRKSKSIYRNIEDLQKNPPQADCYIVGSDQVWAHVLKNKNSEIYYLNFGGKEVKRIAYAASFGMDIYPEKYNKVLSKNLLRFDAISVREKSGVNICSKAGVNAQLVLDPTLLLLGKDYMQFVIQHQEKSEYAFLYLINLTSQEDLYWNTMKPILQNKYKKIICTTATGYCNLKFQLDNCIYKYPSIEKWLSLIFYSSYVITSSFHGVVFSLLFNKPFLYIPLSGKYAKSNNRVIDLLNQIELANRIIYNNNDIKEVIEEQINWKDVNDKIQNLRYFSQEFLDSAI